MNVEAPRTEERSISGYLRSEFVYGGHLLALGTASIAGFCSLLIGFTPTLPLLAMAYLFSFGAYTINRSAEIDEDAISHPDRTSHISARRSYLPFIAGSCFLIGYVLAWFANFPFFIALFSPLILSLAYSVGSKKFMRVVGVKRLKEKLLAKNIVVSFGWSLIPLLVGLYYGRVGIAVFALAPFVFLRLLGATIFFDARDVRGDIANGIRTIPAVFGFSKSFQLMDIFDLASGVYIVGLVASGFVQLYASIMLCFPIYSILYRQIAQKHPSKMGVICDVVCDGEYLLWGPVLVLGRILA